MLGVAVVGILVLAVGFFAGRIVGEIKKGGSIEEEEALLEGRMPQSW